MSLPSRGFRLLHNVVTGYRLAWVHRRQLLPVLLCVLALRLIGSLVLDLLLGGDDMVIVDGRPVVEGEVGALWWLTLALTVTSWLLALTAGTVTVVGALRKSTVDPLRVL